MFAPQTRTRPSLSFQPGFTSFFLDHVPLSCIEWHVIPIRAGIVSGKGSKECFNNQRKGCDVIRNVDHSLSPPAHAIPKLNQSSSWHRHSCLMGYGLHLCVL